MKNKERTFIKKNPDINLFNRKRFNWSYFFSNFLVIVNKNFCIDILSHSFFLLYKIHTDLSKVYTIQSFRKNKTIKAVITGNC